MDIGTLFSIYFICTGIIKGIFISVIQQTANLNSNRCTCAFWTAYGYAASAFACGVVAQISAEHNDINGHGLRRNEYTAAIHAGAIVLDFAIVNRYVAVRNIDTAAVDRTVGILLGIAADDTVFHNKVTAVNISAAAKAAIRCAGSQTGTSYILRYCTSVHGKAAVLHEETAAISTKTGYTCIGSVVGNSTSIHSKASALNKETASVGACIVCGAYGVGNERTVIEDKATAGDVCTATVCGRVVSDCSVIDRYSTACNVHAAAVCGNIGFSGFAYTSGFHNKVTGKNSNTAAIFCHIIGDNNVVMVYMEISIVNAHTATGL